MTLVVVPIVEGQTEQKCLANLLHGIWHKLLQCSELLHVVRAVRGKRDSLIHPQGGTLSKKLEEALLELRRAERKFSDSRGLILLLLDAEDDCPKELALRLRQTAETARSDCDIACVLARRMLENWIVAGASTLANVQGLPAKLPIPNNPDDCHGAGWLDTQLRSVNRGRKYKKTADAAVFVQSMNLEDCLAHSPSFGKLHKALRSRMIEVTTGAEAPAPGSTPQPEPAEQSESPEQPEEHHE